jgi:hypothetical protein
MCELRSKTKKPHLAIGETIKMRSNECARCDKKREMLSLFTVYTIKRKQLTSCWLDTSTTEKHTKAVVNRGMAE